MQVILVEDVEKLGKKGTLVKVRGGYFRNFLFPRGKAVPCTDGNMRWYEDVKAKREKAEKRAKEEAVALRDKLAKLIVVVKTHVGKEGKLFGSVTNQEIARALAEKGIEIDRHKIELSEPLKSLGDHNVRVKPHPEVEASVRVQVVKG